MPRGSTVRAVLRTVIAALASLALSCSVAAVALGTSSSSAAPSPSPAVAAQARLYTLFSSGAVHCQFADGETGQNVRCDLYKTARYGKIPQPPNPCPADWGNSMGVDEYNKAGWGCVGDSVYNENRLPKGGSITAGAITCRGTGDGMKCRSTTSGYGFVLTSKKYDFLRPAGRRQMRSTGVGELRPGMTEAQARKTGTLVKVETDCTGSPGLTLKPTYGGAYVTWRDGRVNTINAWDGDRISTTKGVGVGSELRDLRKAYPRLSKPRRADSSSGHHWFVTATRGKYQTHFLMVGWSERKPWAGTLVDAVVITRSWNPRVEALDFHGC